uniref:Uncharacterized protein n=1 Tax=Archaeoglobus fulgidus TaxID=2234 RepID=A0A7C3REA4_ARCFL
MDARLLEEILKTAKTINEFFITLSDPKTYFKELKEEEIEQFYTNTSKLFFELNRAYWGLVIDLTQAFIKMDAEGVLKAISGGMDRFESIFAEYTNNPVFSAFLNTVNMAYLRSLQNLQTLMSAILHSMGMVSRRDIIALSEAYVDLKGDIKKESRKIREELRLLKEEIEKIRGGSNVS